MSNIKPGDRVAYTGVRGSYAEYAAVPADRLVALPIKSILKLPPPRSAGNDCALPFTQHLSNPTRRHSVDSCGGGRRGPVAGADCEAVGCTRDRHGRKFGKAHLAREAGADEVIIYSEQDFETETKRLTNNEGVHAVYDGVGKATFEKDLNILRPRGYLVLFGGASGAVPPFDLIQLSQKGSLYVTRPSLHHYIRTRAELEQRSGDVLKMIVDGELRIRIHATYPLAEAQQAHRDLEGTKASGKLLLIP